MAEWGLPIGIAAVGVALSVWFGATTWGVFFPDEIFQTLEPAHKLVFGYGFETWESAYAGRNFTLNLLMAVPYAVMALFGVDDPSTHIVVHRSLFALATAAAAIGAWRLARLGGARRLWAAVACATVAWTPIQMALGFRTLTEIPAAALLVWGVALIYEGGGADDHDAEGRDRPAQRGMDRFAHEATFVAGFCCLGLAVLIRLQMAIAVAGLMLTWRWRGQMERYRVGMRILVVWALIYGLVDWIIFGFPFQSAGGYLRFHLILSGSTAYEGMNGPLFYPVVLSSTLGPGVVLGALSPLSWRRWRAPIVGAGLFVALHLLHAHRQIRFVWPVIPLLAGLGAVGAGQLESWLSTRWKPATSVVAAGIAVGIGAWSFEKTPSLTMDDLGQAEILGIDAQTSAWGWRHDLNALLFVAHRRPDLCGLRLVQDSAVNTGGYSFLHRDVPFYHALDFLESDADGDREVQLPNPDAYNYVLARYFVELPSAYRPVVARGNWKLYTNERDQCAPDPDFTARVFRPEEMTTDNK